MAEALSCPDGVGVVEDGDVVYLAVLPAGPIRRLDPSGSLVWRLAQEHPRAQVAEAVGEAVGLPADTVRPDVDAFLDRLLGWGLLA